MCVRRNMFVPSLVTICTNAVAARSLHDTTTLCLLPPHLKDKILAVSTKRANVNNKILHCLLHSCVSTLDLSECLIDDETLEEISICRQLKKLDLSPGRNQKRDISTRALVELFHNLPYLLNISLRRCPAVTDEVVVCISKCCPLLRELDVGYCMSVTDDSLKALQKLKYLKALNVARSKVGDLGIQHLVNGKSQETLSEIHMEMCSRVTDFSIELIMYKCRNIKHLVFHGSSVKGDWQSTMEDIGCKFRELQWTVY